MIRPASSLNGYQLLTQQDGSAGEVRDFIFDDDCWQVRYLVIDTGRWLSARRVLISPEAVVQPEWDARRLPTALTKEQVRRSPEMGEDLPLTRSREEQLRDYFGWKAYWSRDGGDDRGAPKSLPPEQPPSSLTEHPEMVTPAVTPGAGADAEQVAAARGAEEAQEAQDTPQLRSVRELRGYHVESTDGSIGHIDDVLLDDGTWTIRFLVVDTANWWPGKKVLLSPQWIASVSWPESHVVVNLTREQVRAGTVYDPDRLEELQDRISSGRIGA